MSDTPRYIEDFMDAVYPDYGHLALASFNEKTALIDATERIRQLERELAESREENKGLSKAWLEVNEELAVSRAEVERLKMSEKCCNFAESACPNVEELQGQVEWMNKELDRVTKILYTNEFTIAARSLVEAVEEYEKCGYGGTWMIWMILRNHAASVKALLGGEK